MTRVLLDTSAVIAGVPAISLQQGQTAAISVITLGELRAGVTLARDSVVRAARQARLAAIRETFEPLPVDESVAERYGDVLAVARSRKRTSRATDLLIIATAAASGRILQTRDEAQAKLTDLIGVPVKT